MTDEHEKYCKKKLEAKLFDITSIDSDATVARRNAYKKLLSKIQTILVDNCCFTTIASNLDSAGDASPFRLIFSVAVDDWQPRRSPMVSDPPFYLIVKTGTVITSNDIDIVFGIISDPTAATDPSPSYSYRFTTANGTTGSKSYFNITGSYVTVKNDSVSMLAFAKNYANFFIGAMLENGGGIFDARGNKIYGYDENIYYISAYGNDMTLNTEISYDSDVAKRYTDFVVHNAMLTTSSDRLNNCDPDKQFTDILAYAGAGIIADSGAIVQDMSQLEEVKYLEYKGNLYKLTDAVGR